MRGIAAALDRRFRDADVRMAPAVRSPHRRRRTLDGPDDIRRMAATLAYNSMDLLQAAHTWSGIEMALRDLLGHARCITPTWKLLGYDRAYPKTPDASVLFGTTPQETLDRAREMRGLGFRAAR